MVQEIKYKINEAQNIINEINSGHLIHRRLYAMVATEMFVWICHRHLYGFCNAIDTCIALFLMQSTLVLLSFSLSLIFTCS